MRERDCKIEIARKKEEGVRKRRWKRLTSSCSFWSCCTSFLTLLLLQEYLTAEEERELAALEEEVEALQAEIDFKDAG